MLYNNILKNQHVNLFTGSWQRYCFIELHKLVSGKNQIPEEEKKMKRTLLTITITALTIVSWATVVFACGGGGGI
jgi:hypothetical protein